MKWYLDFGHGGKDPGAIGPTNLKESDVNLLKDTKTNTVKVDPKGKYAKLDYEVIKRKDNLALVHINLHTGRSHQIRVQFSSRNHPLYGDQRYNKHAIKGQQIALWAYRITFTHPVLKTSMTFTLEPKDIYPFNIRG